MSEYCIRVRLLHRPKSTGTIRSTSGATSFLAHPVIVDCYNIPSRINPTEVPLLVVTMGLKAVALDVTTVWKL